MRSNSKLLNKNSKYLNLVKMMDDVLSYETSNLDNNTSKILIDKLMVIMKLSKELIMSLLNSSQDSNQEGDCDDYKH